MWRSLRQLRLPKFTAVWLLHAYTLLLIGQILDGLTTKIGFDFGLAEVNPYAMPIANTHGFWGLMLWKFGITAILGVMLAAVYFGAKRFSCERTDVVAKILTVGCIMASIGQYQVVASNLNALYALSQVLNSCGLIP